MENYTPIFENTKGGVLGYFCGNPLLLMSYDFSAIFLIFRKIYKGPAFVNTKGEVLGYFRGNPLISLFINFLFIVLIQDGVGVQPTLNNV